MTTTTKLDTMLDCDEETAAAEFGELNGWLLSDVSFALSTLAILGGQRDDGWDDESWDGLSTLVYRPLYFRQPGKPHRPAALVSQFYGDPESEPLPDGVLDRVRATVRRLGLEFHVPPLQASWLPGRTVYFVFTRPGTAVKWLPEQGQELQPAEFRAASSASNATI